MFEKGEEEHVEVWDGRMMEKEKKNEGRRKQSRNSSFSDLRC